jgi:hypothetical protein
MAMTTSNSISVNARPPGHRTGVSTADKFERMSWEQSYRNLRALQ